jgi:hypothetical protein
MRCQPSEAVATGRAIVLEKQNDFSRRSSVLYCAVWRSQELSAATAVSLFRGVTASLSFMVQLYQDTIPALNGASFGFVLLGGTRVEAAKKLAEMFRENFKRYGTQVSEDVKNAGPRG